MYKFNSDNIITGFIKDLLKSTYVPTLPIWNPDKYLYKDLFYIYNNNVIKAIKDYNPNDWLLRDNNKVQNNNEIKPITDFIEIIKPYIRNKFMPQLNSTYTSYISGYDSETHKYLGDYLRMIRDFDGVDLMQYYNCFNNSYSDKIRIESDNQNKYTIKEYTNNVNDGFDVILIPIKFNQDYTIYINSRSSIDIQTLLFDGINIIDTYHALNSTSGETFNGKHERISYCSFSQPYYFKSDLLTKNNAALLTLEKYYMLAIQLPKDLQSSIVILEGDYRKNKFINTNNNVNSLIQIESDYDTNIKNNNYYLSVPGLTRVAGKTSFAFSNRLIEYLLLNVIDKNDKISENIERIQTYLSTYKSKQLFGNVFNLTSSNKGIWTPALRYTVYNNVTKNYKIPKRIDINGYVDKDSESIVLGGKK